MPGQAVDYSAVHCVCLSNVSMLRWGKKRRYMRVVITGTTGKVRFPCRRVGRFASISVSRTQDYFGSVRSWTQCTRYAKASLGTFIRFQHPILISIHKHMVYSWSKYTTIRFLLYYIAERFCISLRFLNFAKQDVIIVYLSEILLVIYQNCNWISTST